MISKKSDDAVSPVIGVMLMLVVTVVIAAAVTIFATGVVGETEAAPVAVLDVEIFSNQENMAGLSGPELFITHLSGDAVDTDNIELRTSWNCGVDGCTYGGTHYSVFTADGFKNSGTDVGRNQPLYVKSTMKVQKENPEYGSGTTGALDHYFGDVILTPGLRLSASSEFLDMDKGYNTQSRFMDVVFDNYHITIKVKYGPKHPNYYFLTSGGPQTEAHADMSRLATEYPNDACFTGQGTCMYKLYYDMKMTKICDKCGHLCSLCTIENDPGYNCLCVEENDYGTPIVTGGIMNHLQPGTKVDFMIVHIPSGKAIYDNTVVVQ